MQTLEKSTVVCGLSPRVEKVLADGEMKMPRALQTQGSSRRFSDKKAGSMKLRECGGSEFFFELERKKELRERKGKRRSMRLDLARVHCILGDLRRRPLLACLHRGHAGGRPRIHAH